MAGSIFRLVLVVLLVVPSCRSGAPGDGHSLQYVFDITFNEQLQCVAKVFMNRTLILKYDCYNEKVIYERQEVMTANDSKDMKNMLKSMWDQVRSKLTREILRDSSILQVRLEYKCDANGIFSGPLEFYLDGQRSLVFDLESGEYTASNSRGEEMKKTWENDEEMKEFFKMTSKGDGKRLAKVLLNRMKKPETTAAQIMATTTGPGPATGKAVMIKDDLTWILTAIFILTTLGI